MIVHRFGFFRKASLAVLGGRMRESGAAGVAEGASALVALHFIKCLTKEKHENGDYYG